MAKGFFREETCAFKVKVYLNSQGNILQPGETPAGEKQFTFGNFASSLTASESVNDENSPAIHNGVAGLIWLLSGSDENFDPNIKRTLIEEVDDV